VRVVVAQELLDKIKDDHEVLEDFWYNLPLDDFQVKYVLDCVEFSFTLNSGRECQC
jgi:hypothetical protein